MTQVFVALRPWDPDVELTPLPVMYTSGELIFHWDMKSKMLMGVEVPDAWTVIQSVEADYEEEEDGIHLGREEYEGVPEVPQEGQAGTEGGALHAEGGTTAASGVRGTPAGD